MLVKQLVNRRMRLWRQLERVLAVAPAKRLQLPTLVRWPAVGESGDDERRPLRKQGAPVERRVKASRVLPQRRARVAARRQLPRGEMGRSEVSLSPPAQLAE